MLSSILQAPFPDASRQAHYEAVHATLAAAGTEGLLLGNLEVAGETLDAVVVLPHGVTVLLLVAGGGQLTVPRLTTDPWLLDGQPLPGFGSADDNPLQRWQRQREALVAWLAWQPKVAPVPAAAITGLVVFGQPVTFGTEVEKHLRVHPAADDLQLLAHLPQLPRRLQHVEGQVAFSSEDLRRWAVRLQQELNAGAASSEEPAPDTAQGFWAHKAQQVWRWLGAEDVPADPPYDSRTSAPDAVAASQQEKQRLEQMRQQVRTEVSQQTQAMEAREAERDHTIAQLRQQLAAASAAAPETARLQAQLAREAREKVALEEAIRAARAESAARNRELDARIQQLGQLIEQLQARPAPPVPEPQAGSAPVRTAPRLRQSAPVLQQRPTAQPWRLRWARLAAVVAVAGGLGALGTWSLSRLPLARRPAAEEVARPATRAVTENENLEAAAPTLFDIQPDTVHLSSGETQQSDSEVTEPAEPESTEPVPVQAPPAAEQDEVMDPVEAPDDDENSENDDV